MAFKHKQLPNYTESQTDWFGISADHNLAGSQQQHPAVIKGAVKLQCSNRSIVCEMQEAIPSHNTAAELS